jgi:hypothetical protein
MEAKDGSFGFDIHVLYYEVISNKPLEGHKRWQTGS